MIENDKYYIPSAEEFCIGFEYEVLQAGNKREFEDGDWSSLMEIDREDKWVKTKYPDPFLGYNTDRILDTYSVRTKYLDKEDIEELDFIYIKEEKPWLLFKKGNIYLILRNENTDRFNIIISYSEECIQDKIFKGIIKNKSEFKRLLTQLEIL